MANTQIRRTALCLCVFVFNGVLSSTTCDSTGADEDRRHVERSAADSGGFVLFLFHARTQASTA
jgi:hypothetical protein